MAKKMSTQKKVAIGAGVAAVAAILCYFFCPCFKKKGVATTDADMVSYGAGPMEETTNNGMTSGPLKRKVPAPMSPVTVMQKLQEQRNGLGIHRYYGPIT